MRSCSAIGCTNRDTKENRAKGIRFYKIPVKINAGFGWPPCEGKISIPLLMQRFAVFILLEVRVKLINRLLVVVIATHVIMYKPINHTACLQAFLY